MVFLLINLTMKIKSKKYIKKYIKYIKNILNIIIIFKIISNKIKGFVLILNNSQKNYYFHHYDYQMKL